MLELVGVAWSKLELVGVGWSGLELVGVTWSWLRWIGVAWSGLEWLGAQYDKALFFTPWFIECYVVSIIGYVFIFDRNTS